MYGISRISVVDSVSLITFHRYTGDFHDCASIFDAVASAGINIDMISRSAPQSGTTDLSFSAPDSDFPKIMDIIADENKGSSHIRPMVSTNNCKISLYGEEMRTTPGVAAHVFATIASTGADVMLVTTSEVDISLLIPELYKDIVLETLNKEFVL